MTLSFNSILSLIFLSTLKALLCSQHQFGPNQKANHSVPSSSCFSFVKKVFWKPLNPISPGPDHHSGRKSFSMAMTESLAWRQALTPNPGMNTVYYPKGDSLLCPVQVLLPRCAASFTQPTQNCFLPQPEVSPLSHGCAHTSYNSFLHLNSALH